MLHPENPCLSIHKSNRGEANTSHVEQKQAKGFEGEVAHAIIRPWAMMIHFVNTSIALSAVVHA